MGVHPPTVAGIFGGAETGAYSVAVSAGYPEDLDLGDTFTYTGSGGRELKKKNLRTAAQSSDQTLVRGNAALDKSARTGNPIRVIRGFKAPMGPVTGYRYDGLYKVIRSYEALNSDNKFKVYKFDFERLPGQQPVDYGYKDRVRAEEMRARELMEARAKELEASLAIELEAKELEELQSKELEEAHPKELEEVQPKELEAAQTKGHEEVQFKELAIEEALAKQLGEELQSNEEAIAKQLEEETQSKEAEALSKQEHTAEEEMEASANQTTASVGV